jgi:translation initiation factor IF-3
MEKKPTHKPGKPYPRRDFRREKEDEHRINQRITAAEVRLVGDNVEQGVYPTAVALKMAQEQEIDLVEISPNATPPVCRVIDYKKFLYDQKKKQKEMKAKQVNVTVKEIRFGPNTDDHDFQFKLKHAFEFLKEGNKVRSWVFFKGRSIVFKDRGEILLLKFIQELSEVGVPEQLPKLEGKKMFVIINPKKK